MTEIVARGLETCLTEAFAIAIATDDCDGVFLSVDIDVCDPGHAPGTGTPEPGGFSARQLLDAVRRICYELPVLGVDVVEVAPPYDHADITALLGNRPDRTTTDTSVRRVTSVTKWFVHHCPTRRKALNYRSFGEFDRISTLRFY